jgi:hypothetical protein
MMIFHATPSPIFRLSRRSFHAIAGIFAMPLLTLRPPLIFDIDENAMRAKSSAMPIRCLSADIFTFATPLSAR